MAKLLGFVLVSIAVAFLGKAAFADSIVDRDHCDRMANAIAQAECYRSLVERDHIGSKAEYERCLGITPHTGRANCFRALLSEKVRDKAAHPPTRGAELSPPPASGSPGHVEETVYGFLEKRSGESPYSPNYGLYSYILFPSSTDRARRFLEKFFASTSIWGKSELPPERLNLVFVPVGPQTSARLTELISSSGGSPTNSVATEVYNSYNYDLARDLLAQFCGKPAAEVRDLCATDLSRGPYIFTYPRPASDVSSVTPPYLFVDLSEVHERAFDEFIAAYKAQVREEDYTAKKRLKALRLALVSIVLTAADWVDPVTKSVTDIIHVAAK